MDTSASSGPYADVSVTRTTTPDYPEVEERAMMAFYGGKRCLIKWQLTSVQWAHVLNASLTTSNLRLNWMYMRGLRQPRNEPHAAKLRENLVPLSADLHIAMDTSPCPLCIFPHEDTVARTLSYELDVKKYRLAEIRQGRGDPGRPSYEQGYPVVQTTNSTGPILQHRVFLRLLGDEDVSRRVRDATTQRYVTKIYTTGQCPGMPSPPPGTERFPIIDTLLSIPFSLLHNTPRLVSQVPYTSYQATLLLLATKVIELWSWDPSPEELQQVGMIGTSTQRASWPASVFDGSRNSVTFESYRSYFEPTLPSAPPPVPPTSNTQTSSNHEILHSLPAGQVAIGGAVAVTYDMEEGLGTSAMSIDAEASKELASLSSWPKPVSEQSCSSHTCEHSPLPKDPIRRTADEIESWRKGIELGGSENISIAHSPFERGCIGDCSVNDRLMVMGLIDPQIWVRFWDLSVF